MIRTLARNWWLLALAAVLDAVIAAIYLSHYVQDAGFHSMSSVVHMGEIALAAGVATIAAGLRQSPRSGSWLLLLNGFALGWLGILLTGLFGDRIRFVTVALLIIAMGISIGALELLSLRHHFGDAWLSITAAAVSVAFVLAFIALALRWIKVEPGSLLDLLWLGAYFVFSAIWKLSLALRPAGQRVFREALHAH